jgi:hypothetical protein
MDIDFLPGLAYWLGLLFAALLPAIIKPGWPYVLACIAFVITLIFASVWATSEEDGPAGFAVLAFHGLIFWVFVGANVIKWIVIACRAVRRKFPGDSMS